MTENKDNPPINLELLERQLREALARRPSETTQDQQVTAHSEDPLAELSRLTGYENQARSPQQPFATQHAIPPHAQGVISASEAQDPHPVSDPYATFPKFSVPQPLETPTPPPVSNSLRANIPLFQSIAVNYGGFQNSALAQPLPEPAPQPIQPPIQQNPIHHSFVTPIDQPNPSHQETLPHLVEGATASVMGAQPQLAHSNPYRESASAHEHHEPQPHNQPLHAFAENPYESLEKPVSPPQPVQDQIFESRIFSNLRAPAVEPQAFSQPHDSNAAQHDAMWPPQQEPRAGLSMSEAEAHDDLLHLAQKEKKSSSEGKGAYILLGLLAILGLGFGLATYLRNEGAVIPLGPAPVISADKTPVKIAPVDQGGSQSAPQAAAIYQPGKMDDPKEAKIVNNEEKPVDVNTVPRPPGAPLLGEPKKIRTVTIRPDGSVVEENTTTTGASVPNVAANPRPGATIAPTPAAPQPTASAAVPVPAVPNVAALAGVTQQPAGSSPQGPVVRVLPPERPQNVTAPPAPAAPPPQAVEKPAAAQVAATEKIEAGSGDYGVQFGAPASENEARTMIANLKKSNAKIFDGLSFVVQKADNGGRTIFRVRVIGLARDGAVSLCEKMKSSGTQCFVAKN